MESQHRAVTSLSTAKEREFYRYYNPESFDNVYNTSACSSQDTALTAFAQLGALRIQARRCMISLFDNTQQYIIAEATKTLSLQSDSVYEGQDALWLGTTTLPKESGICTIVADLPSTSAPLDAKNINEGIVIIQDLTKDDRFAQKDFVREKPFARFYAGVPIRSPKGYNLGSYCVIDDQPREGLTASAIQFMKDMAATVMSYLELARTREEHRRGERMVRGLGSFHEGKSTLRNWRPVGASAGNDDRAYEPSRLSRGGEGQLNQEQQDAQVVEDLSQEPGDSLARLTEGSGNSYNTNRPATLVRKIAPSFTFPGAASQSSGNAAMTFEYGLLHPDTANSKAVPDATQITQILSPNEDLLSVGVKATFNRASNIIRESIEVEGALFVDAAIGSYGGLVPGDVSSEASESAFSSSLASSSGENSSKDGSRTSRTTSTHPRVERMCGVLGFSTSTTSSINNNITSKLHGLVPEGLLKGLLKRYPRGKIFHFSEDGQASSGSSSEAPDSHGQSQSSGYSNHMSTARARRKAERKFSRRTDAEVLLKIFPNARSIAITGLWDSHRSRWFSLGIVWTNSPKRVLTVEGDLSYLGSFGNCIMAEVTRLDALTAEKAKSDLLGSISHELRSPLHGILGSVELLEESASSSMQMNLVQSIETCGRTLLDTIDHLLDYTKINHSSQMLREKRNARHQRHDSGGLRERKNNSEDAASNLNSNVDICAITEEVLTAVSAGHDTHRIAASRQGRGGRAPGPVNSSNGNGIPEDSVPWRNDKVPRSNNVAINIDISATPNWMFITQAGAWRRIVMNLFSNSLKYTERGFINVALKTETLPKLRGRARSKVILKVTDSGKGMSTDYMQGRLFTPFAQEDQLAPGTGLGLSIIQQIIKGLGGKIEIRSTKNDVGHGTDVCVTIPMTHSDPIEEAHSFNSDELGTMLPLTRDLDVCLMGFRKTPGTPGTRDGSMVDYKSSALENLCRDWYQMNVRSDIDSITAPDLYIIIENEANREDLRTGNLFEQLQQKNALDGSKKSLQIIVICRTPSSTHDLDRSSSELDSQKIVEYVCQPCGPHKLGKALIRCIKRRVELTSSTFSRPQINRYLTPEDDFSSSPVVTSGCGIQPVNGTVTPPSPLSESEQSPFNSPVRSTLHDSAPFLLVDDNHINIQVLEMYMSKKKLDCAVAQNGLEALEAYKAAKSPFKTILMDISMPVMDGLTSTRLIRAFERETDMRPATIIVLTGLGSASIQQEAYSSGANLLLTKPVRLKELGKVLADQSRSMETLGSIG